MKAKLDNSKDVWTPLQVVITLDTKEEYESLKNIYSVQEVTSLEPEHRVRDRNTATNLIAHIIDAVQRDRQV
mgnify:CR=1 FL=1